MNDGVNAGWSNQGQGTNIPRAECFDLLSARASTLA